MNETIEELLKTQTENEVVSHCKDKEYARGWWVVDNLLGHRKSLSQNAKKPIMLT